MKSRFIVILFFQFLLAGAQMNILSDQYLLNMMAVNPAYAGSQNCVSTLFSYRSQWSGMQGAPETVTFATHSPLHFNRMGIGGSIINDKIGIQNKTYIMGNYAYRIKMHQSILALGFGAGISIYNTDWHKLVTLDKDDPKIAEYPETKVLSNFSLGAWYERDRFFAGLSLPMFISHKTDSSSGSFVFDNNAAAYNYFITSGYTFYIDENFSFQPSGLVKFRVGQSAQFDLTSQFSYKDFIWIGLTYRTTRSIVGLFQIQVQNQFRLAYSYSFNFGEFYQNHRISHEITLRYDLVRIVKADNPRQY